jgi:endonuclease G
VFDLIGWARARGRLTELVIGASADNSGNQKLRTIADQFRLAQGGEGEPERIVVEGVPFENAGQWLEKFARLRRAVCRFEPQPATVSLQGFGSAFLVAPDVIMTNFHVAGHLSDASATAAVARFDYELDLNGNEQPGHAIKLATPWRLASDATLDYVLVRLATRATDLPGPGGAAGEYIRLIAHDFTQNEPIVILQHPMAAPLKLAFGTVILPADGNGVTYSANTEPGSSGSPAMTTALKTVAIHHQGLDKMNRGVRMAPILDHLAATNKLGLLGP